IVARKCEWRWRARKRNWTAPLLRRSKTPSLTWFGTPSTTASSPRKSENGWEKTRPEGWCCGPFTKAGRSTSKSRTTEPPAQFFLWIKLIEAAAHLRPTWLSRLVRHEFPDVQRLLRWCFIHTSAVWVTEIYEQLAHVMFHQAGRIQPDLARLLLPSGQRGSSSSIHPQTARAEERRVG